jgi:hypothetical protein
MESIAARMRNRRLLAERTAALSVSIPLAADARAGVQSASPRGPRPAPLATASAEKVAEAYAQFLLGHRVLDQAEQTLELLLGEGEPRQPGIRRGHAREIFGRQRLQVEAAPPGLQLQALVVEA